MANYNTIPGNVVITPGQTVQRKIDDSGWEGITLITQAQVDAKADLVGGVVPAAQLPSYVDDVLEYANLAAFPGTGESSKIYVADDTNLTYRWSGSAYVNIATSIALGETSSTAYRGDRGKTGYDHSQVVTGNPHGTAKSDLSLGNVDNTSDVNKPVSTAQQTVLDAKFNSPTGTTSQYLRGDGTVATLPTAAARSFNNAPTITVVTTAAAANGTQVDSVRDATVSYTVSTSTTATIGGASTAAAVLEICATNSATASDWLEIGRVSNGQTITLAIVLQSVQTLSGTLQGVIPAGYYRRVRSIVAGTSSVTYTSGQEVKL